MKKFLIVLGLLVSFSANADWKFIGTSKTNEPHYLNLPAVRSDNNGRVETFWVKVETGNETLRFLTQIHCSSGMSRIIQGQTYNKNGEVTHSSPYDLNVNWSVISPDSMGIWYKNSVCTEVVAQPAIRQTTPAISDDQIKQNIIQQSIASYPKTCACPYSIARNGSQCGGRSAYSKPGGYDPICYPADVTPQMIQNYRRQYGQ